jgi:hypothetical protein
MTYKDTIFVATFLAVVFCLVGFGGIRDLSQYGLATPVAVVLSGFGIAALIVGIVLYRARESMIRAQVWSLVATAIPSFVYLFTSFTFARRMLGNAQATLVLLVWLAVVAGMMVWLTIKPTRPRASARVSTAVALFGVLSLILLVVLGVISVKTFVLVICGLVIACGLGLVAASAAIDLFRRERRARGF